ncbi:MAG: GNAT family N-acetyltransferase [Candidatus Marinimicrobia bacterium]|nr:GNAT family N-acetyltransferase [FCB group bacterium]MBL7025180.1 GNAT family N-acetyltransferase [Candidatus Neomarinimicrobiota bacterium]
MSKQTIRWAVSEDIPSIVSFNQAMALETENISLNSEVLKAGVEAIFSNPSKGFYIVCEIDGIVRACLMITYEWSDWRNGLFWWIQSVFVHKEYRQKGLYKHMYKFVKTQVDESEEIVGIRLYVDNNNEKAQKVYSRLGMEKSNYQLFEYSKPTKNP